MTFTSEKMNEVFERSQEKKTHGGLRQNNFPEGCADKKPNKQEPKAALRKISLNGSDIPRKCGISVDLVKP